MSIPVTVNGEPADLTDGATVADLVARRSSGHDRVAVARNGDVVPRSSWTSTALAAGDVLEVLAPTAGG
jgi:sulfur carrier protein